MLHTLQVAERAADVTRTLTQNLPFAVSDGALRMFRGLHYGAVEAAQFRGYSPTVTEVTVHIPAEQLAAALGCSRMSVWRYAVELRRAGLIDNRAHKGSCRGQTRNTGSLWAVRLHPGRGRAARLSRDDLRHRWRDLDRAARSGRTSYELLKERRAGGAVTYKDTSLEGVDTELIKSWVLAPMPAQTPLGMYVTGEGAGPQLRQLEAVLDVQSAPREERNRMVELAAEALAGALRDSSSVSFYARLLWQLLRVADAGGGLAACRARADVAEGYGRRPGAVFVSRLKRAPWWSEVWSAPPRRVGTLPA
jgi:hypothetical protein